MPSPTAVSNETAVLPPERKGPIQDYRCATCGYGVSVRDIPDSCPMCHSTVWEPTVWQPFSRLARLPGDDSFAG